MQNSKASDISTLDRFDSCFVTKFVNTRKNTSRRIRLAMKGVSLFSSAGIGDAFLKDIGIDIVVANELVEERAGLYSAIYPNTKVIIGDILDNRIYEQILNKSGSKIDFLLATPPCQGMSIAGKNRNPSEMFWDERNYLVFRIIDFIKKKSPDFVLIENVPQFLKSSCHTEANFTMLSKF